MKAWGYKNDAKTPRLIGGRVPNLIVSYHPFPCFFSVSGHGNYGRDSSMTVLLIHGDLTLHFDQRRQKERPLERSDHALPEAIVLHSSLKSSKRSMKAYIGK